MANTYKEVDKRQEAYSVFAGYILDRTFSQVLSLKIEELDAIVSDFEDKITERNRAKSWEERLLSYMWNGRNPDSGSSWKTSADTAFDLL
jgi:hypothetical protein